jgi:hypothetical protein
MADVADKQPHPIHEHRWADGTQRPGFPSPRTTHGVDSFKANGPAALPNELRQSVSEFRAQLIADLGGTDGLSAIAMGHVRRLVELETVMQLLASDIATRGLLTKGGRVRSTHGRWLRTTAAWYRYAEKVEEIARSRQRSTLTLTQRLAAAPLTSETEVFDAGE